MPQPHASQTTLKRIHREIADLKKEDLGPITLTPSEDSLFLWSATIPGPEGSCYEGGVFHADIRLSTDYPFTAPSVTFRTRIYHMNINERGNICIDILKHNWSPALSLFKVILSLSSLLTDPNPKDPLVPSIATQYVQNRSKHDREARRWTELYARPTPPAGSTKSKGKAKDPAVTTATASATTSVTASRTAVQQTPAGGLNSETIVLDDTEQTVSAPTPTAGTKRKRPIAGGVDIDLSTDDDDVPARAAARRRTSHPHSSAPADEVIVIED